MGQRQLGEQALVSGQGADTGKRKGLIPQLQVLWALEPSATSPPCGVGNVLTCACRRPAQPSQPLSSHAYLTSRAALSVAALHTNQSQFVS